MQARPPTQARQACRTWPARGCRPASAPPRKLFPPFAGHAGQPEM